MHTIAATVHTNLVIKIVFPEEDESKATYI